MRIARLSAALVAATLFACVGETNDAGSERRSLRARFPSTASR